ncbi:YbdD/YjiX family protein [Neisseriaceae bacterium CLB008]|nr:YbdD/YjiX family protein [Neisseriaceae bacterium]
MWIKLKAKLGRWWRLASDTGRLMVGVPNYERYVAQRRRHNPQAPVMTEQQFVRYCAERRHNSGSGKCC